MGARSGWVEVEIKFVAGIEADVGRAGVCGSYLIADVASELRWRLTSLWACAVVVAVV